MKLIIPRHNTQTWFYEFRILLAWARQAHHIPAGGEALCGALHCEEGAPPPQAVPGAGALELGRHCLVDHPGSALHLPHHLSESTPCAHTRLRRSVLREFTPSPTAWKCITIDPRSVGRKLRIEREHRVVPVNASEALEEPKTDIEDIPNTRCRNSTFGPNLHRRLDQADSKSEEHNRTLVFAPPCERGFSL